jgi:LPXTG-motif cell wall-anchored protein
VAPTLPFTGTPGAAAPAASTPTPTVAATGGLPFTGADVEEIAVVGLGAVLAGGLLMLRRRRSNA